MATPPPPPSRPVPSRRRRVMYDPSTREPARLLYLRALRISSSGQTAVNHRHVCCSRPPPPLSPIRLDADGPARLCRPKVTRSSTSICRHVAFESPATRLEWVFFFLLLFYLSRNGQITRVWLKLARKKHRVLHACPSLKLNKMFKRLYSY